jgi:hypothetical protein
MMNAMAELEDDIPFDDLGENRAVPEQAPLPDQQLEPDPYFCPPPVPTLVHCLHCNEEYESYLIEWREYPGRDGEREGRWCCPMPGCDGVGFCFDIFPVDPEWRDEHGNKVWYDDDEGDESEFDDDDAFDAQPSDELGLVDDDAEMEQFSPERHDLRPAPPRDEDIPF